MLGERTSVPLHLFRFIPIPSVDGHPDPLSVLLIDDLPPCEQSGHSDERPSPIHQTWIHYFPSPPDQCRRCGAHFPHHRTHEGLIPPGTVSQATALGI